MITISGCYARLRIGVVSVCIAAWPAHHLDNLNAR
jgi:hypothetical protein